MTNSFLEDQAKARGMTVSEMMAERGLKADPSKRGFASMAKKNPKKFQQALEKSAKTRQHEKTNPSTKSQG